MRHLAALALLTVLPIAGHAQNEKNLIAPDATLRKLAGDFSFTEDSAPDNYMNIGNGSKRRECFHQFCAH